ncbi:uncharacterized protein LOC108682197 [Hyalella azteca]|uniref:Uncharacterized protein LOC108682197 n=1 Tax=Hyalella azteca TaxID=294128 RepID=A0A8B7PKV6_HYAAZ|nr:uncharacterized protein LOC108682197 [Hyalella azteca]
MSILHEEEKGIVPILKSEIIELSESDMEPLANAMDTASDRTEKPHKICESLKKDGDVRTANQEKCLPQEVNSNDSIGSSLQLHKREESKNDPGTTTLKADQDHLWSVYLLSASPASAPDVAFLHVEESLTSDIEPGQLVEIICERKLPSWYLTVLHCCQEVQIKSPEKDSSDKRYRDNVLVLAAEDLKSSRDKNFTRNTYWVAKVVSACGPLLSVQYMLPKTVMSDNLWVQIGTDQVYAVGHGEKQGIVPAPPVDVILQLSGSYLKNSIFQDSYKEKTLLSESQDVQLVAELLQFLHACSKKHVSVNEAALKTETMPSFKRLKAGGYVEVLSHAASKNGWPACIEQNVGGRLLLRFVHPDWLSQISVGKMQSNEMEKSDNFRETKGGSKTTATCDDVKKEENDLKVNEERSVHLMSANKSKQKEFWIFCTDRRLKNIGWIAKRYAEGYRYVDPVSLEATPVVPSDFCQALNNNSDMLVPITLPVSWSAELKDTICYNSDDCSHKLQDTSVPTAKGATPPSGANRDEGEHFEAADMVDTAIDVAEVGCALEDPISEKENERKLGGEMIAGREYPTEKVETLLNNGKTLSTSPMRDVAKDLCRAADSIIPSSDKMSRTKQEDKIISDSCMLNSGPSVHIPTNKQMLAVDLVKNEMKQNSAEEGSIIGLETANDFTGKCGFISASPLSTSNADNAVSSCDKSGLPKTIVQAVKVSALVETDAATTKQFYVEKLESHAEDESRKLGNNASAGTMTEIGVASISLGNANKEPNGEDQHNSSEKANNSDENFLSKNFDAAEYVSAKAMIHELNEKTQCNEVSIERLSQGTSLTKPINALGNESKLSRSDVNSSQVITANICEEPIAEHSVGINLAPSNQPADTSCSVKSKLFISTSECETEHTDCKIEIDSLDGNIPSPELQRVSLGAELGNRATTSDLTNRNVQVESCDFDSDVRVITIGQCVVNSPTKTRNVEPVVAVISNDDSMTCNVDGTLDVKSRNTSQVQQETGDGNAPHVSDCSKKNEYSNKSEHATEIRDVPVNDFSAACEIILSCDLEKVVDTPELTKAPLSLTQNESPDNNNMMDRNADTVKDAAAETDERNSLAPGMVLELVNPIKLSCIHAAVVSKVAQDGAVEVMYSLCEQVTSKDEYSTEKQYVKSERTSVKIEKAEENEPCNDLPIPDFDRAENFGLKTRLLDACKYSTYMNDYLLLPTGFCQEFGAILHPLKTEHLKPHLSTVDCKDYSVPVMATTNLNSSVLPDVQTHELASETKVNATTKSNENVALPSVVRCELSDKTVPDSNSGISFPEIQHESVDLGAHSNKQDPEKSEVDAIAKISLPSIKKCHGKLDVALSLDGSDEAILPELPKMHDKSKSVSLPIEGLDEGKLMLVKDRDHNDSTDFIDIDVEIIDETYSESSCDMEMDSEQTPPTNESPNKAVQDGTVVVDECLDERPASPIGVNCYKCHQSFEWETFLAANPSHVRVPLSYFSFIPLNADTEFSAGHKLEVVHPEDPSLICAATIAATTGHLLWLRVDSLPNPGLTSAESEASSGNGSSQLSNLVKEVDPGVQHLFCDCEKPNRILIEHISSLDVFPVGWAHSNHAPFVFPPPKTSVNVPVIRMKRFSASSASDSNAARRSRDFNSLKLGSIIAPDGTHRSRWCPTLYLNHCCWPGPYLSSAKLGNFFAVT